MRSERRERFSIPLCLVLCLCMLAIAGSVEAKSMYLVANHHTGQFDAYDIGVGGTVAYQARYTLTYATDPAGVAVWQDHPTHPTRAFLFLTSEFSSGVEFVDAITMTSRGRSSGPSDLAGIDVDDANNIVYSIRRATNDLYVFAFNPNTMTLTPQAGSPIQLPGCSGAMGIALDELHNRLYLADTSARVVRGYNTTTWAQEMSYTPSGAPLGIAVDRVRGFIYTVTPDGSCANDQPTSSYLLCKYDIATGAQTTVNKGHGGMGIAVNEDTGYVYITEGCAGDALSVWNPHTTPFTQIQRTADLGNPAGVAIGNVSFNPLNLEKYDGLNAGGCVHPSRDLTYSLCFDNAQGASDVHNVRVVDQLPSEVSWLSGGSYDPVSGQVVWDAGTLPAGATEQCVQLAARVNPGTPENSTILNSATIDSDETPATTDTIQTMVCTGCETIPNVFVEYRGVTFNRITKVMSGNCTIRNDSPDTLIPEVRLIVESISSDPLVTVANADGVTDDGKPYFDFSASLGADGRLSPGETTSAKVIQFNNPNQTRFRWTYSVCAYVE
ncbi:hypothetical protein HZA56_07030 [Candidatus Poribacteria bacterium]|nr:hypothetical protein [Candidatus Poribacteria bacterium]